MTPPRISHRRLLSLTWLSLITREHCELDSSSEDVFCKESSRSIALVGGLIN